MKFAEPDPRSKYVDPTGSETQTGSATMPLLHLVVTDRCRDVRSPRHQEEEGQGGGAQGDIISVSGP